jgi:hypothetical protein
MAPSSMSSNSEAGSQLLNQMPTAWHLALLGHAKFVSPAKQLASEAAIDRVNSSTSVAVSL